VRQSSAIVALKEENGTMPTSFLKSSLSALKSLWAGFIPSEGILIFHVDTMPGSPFSDQVDSKEKSTLVDGESATPS
jgi:hypothetical protein